MGAIRVGMPSCSSLAPAVLSGSPTRSRVTSLTFPSSRLFASPAASQRPSLVMPIGTTSNFSRSMDLRTEAADSSETSCSPLRPPKRMPTRSFFAIVFFRRRSEYENYNSPSVEPFTESSSQMPSKQAPQPGQPSDCVRRLPDSPRQARSSATAHGPPKSPSPGALRGKLPRHAPESQLPAHLPDRSSQIGRAHV